MKSTNICEYNFFTSGPWEFRWGKYGKIEYCGHPLGDRINKLNTPKANPDKKIRCPQCNVTNMLFLVPYHPFEMDCPKCKRGKIHPGPINIL